MTHFAMDNEFFDCVLQTSKEFGVIEDFFFFFATVLLLYPADLQITANWHCFSACFMV